MTSEHDGRHPVAEHRPGVRTGPPAPDGDDWSTTLKSACVNGEFAPALAAEAAHRAAEGRLSLRDLRILLLVADGHPGWHPAREAAIAQVAQGPDLAGQLLLMHAQMELWPPPAVTESTRSTATGETIHEARARIGPPGREVAGAACPAATPKAARQRALLNLLSRLAGVADPLEGASVPLPRASRTPPPGLDQEVFETLLHRRAAQDDGPGEELLEEILLRAASSRLRHRDVELLLFHTDGPPWTAARRAALDTAARMPPTAETLLHWHAERTACPGTAYHDGTGGNDAAPAVHTVTASFDTGNGTVHGSPRQAKSHKVARHYAAVNLLARLVGLPEPRVTVLDRPESEKQVAPARPGEDPLKLLNKYTQLEVITKPVYTFHRAGPGARAAITCTVSCDYRGRRPGVQATGKARTKAESRIAAARALIGALCTTDTAPAPPPATRATVPAARKNPAPPAASRAAMSIAEEALKARCALVYLPGPTPRAARLLIHRADGRPMPATPLPAPLTRTTRELVLTGPDGVHRAPVEGWALPLADAAGTLLNVADHPAAHHSVRAWAQAARIGLQLIAARLVYPALTTAGLDTWRIGPLPDGARLALDGLAERMPPHAHCTAVGGQPRIPPAHHTLRDFLDALADALLRPPGAPALFGDLPHVTPTARPAHHLRLWTDTLEDRCEGGAPPGLVLRIHPPSAPDAADGRLRATLLLRPSGAPAADGAAHEAEAAQVFEGTAHPPGLGPAVRPKAVRALRRAARHWPPLKRLADQNPPTGLTLTGSDILELLGEAEESLAGQGVEVRWPERLRTALGTRTVVGDPAHGRFGLTELLDFRWQLLLDGAPLSESEMDRLVEATRPLVRLRDQWVLVDPHTARRAGQRRLEPLTGTAALTAALSGTVTVDGQDFACEPAGALAEVVATLRDGESAGRPVAVPLALTARLRDYQHRALTWLARTTELGFGVCLADDMGLGKTLTGIAFHLHRKENGSPGPTLVICPSSLVTNWAREIGRFAPGTEVIRYHGNDRTLATLSDASVVVTTYGILRRDHAELAAIGWGLVMADEAQHVKNHRTRTAHRLRELRSGTRVALTGTPVENTLDELWAILDWANPGLFGTLARFRAQYARDVTREAAGDTDGPVTRQLTRLIGPFLLRRRKSDPGIAPELPPKVHQERVVQLTAEQVALYEANVREAMAAVEGTRGPGRHNMVLQLLTALKQICNHPAHYLHNRNPQPTADEPPFAERSAKLKALEELLATIGERGESALVFTSYVVMGNLLHTHLTGLGLNPLFLHGATGTAQRQQMVDAFQAGHHRILILSLRAAGTGLNLTRATHVIHYDRTWNPAIEDQATDRAHRIGQHRTVHVHQLISEGTVEDRIAALLHSKRALHNAILAGGERALGALSDQELAALVTLGRNP